MRTMVLSLAVLAALGLAGCSHSGSNSTAQKGQAMAQSGSTAQTQIASSVSGTIGLRNPKAHTLSSQAVLTIKLMDVSTQGAAPLASKTISPITSMPVNFSFKLKPGEVHASDLYVVQAQLVDGIRHYTMPLQAPVLTKGASSHANIKLVAVPTPAEKMLTAFKSLKAQAGAMNMTKGTSLNKHESRGWQVFKDQSSGKIRYVVELTNVVKGGFTHTEFAYKKGKPWVVVLQKKSSQKAKPSETERAGWDANGNLVLKQKVADGKTTTLDAKDAAKLHKDAIAMLARAKKTK